VLVACLSAPVGAHVPCARALCACFARVAPDPTDKQGRLAEAAAAAVAAAELGLREADAALAKLAAKAERKAREAVLEPSPPRGPAETALRAWMAGGVGGALFGAWHSLVVVVDPGGDDDNDDDDDANFGANAGGVDGVAMARTRKPLRLSVCLDGFPLPVYVPPAPAAAAAAAGTGAFDTGAGAAGTSSAIDSGPPSPLMRLKPSADCADAGELSNTGAAALATAADSATAAAAAAAAAPATFAEAPAGFLWSLAAAGGVHLANVTKAGGLSLLRGAPRGGAVASVVCFDRALEAKESAKASAAFGGCVSAVEVAPSQVSTRLPPKSTHSRVWSLSRVLILRFRGPRCS